ncbi:hypothetical protein LB507_009288, partial [Fusarium sp. FIESC RH6]
STEHAMSSRTFHPFLKLPYELRLLIWEASCFNGNEKTRHGLNYVDVSDTDDIKCRPADDTTTSACLMDTGLWEACDESRLTGLTVGRFTGLPEPRTMVEGSCTYSDSSPHIRPRPLLLQNFRLVYQTIEERGEERDRDSGVRFPS